MTSEHDSPQDRPQLRLTGSLGDEDAPDAADSPFLATRMGVLTHELAGLLDGSMRCLGMARQSLGTPSGSNASVEQQLQTVHTALERMAGIVHNAMQGAGSSIGSSVSPTESSVTLAEAIEHTLSVLAPLAKEHRVEVNCMVAPEAASRQAGPVYAVMLNGLRNAIESVATSNAGGRVDLDLSFMPGNPGVFSLKITDDGPGLAPACEEGRAFIIGLTTKPGGSGIGLCLCAQIIGQLGGQISLTTHKADAADGRRGALLEASWPVTEKHGPIG